MTENRSVYIHPDGPMHESDGPSLFSAFAASSRYGDVRDKMLGFLSEHAAEGTEPGKELYGRFSGGVYEELAYFALGEGTESDLLLSPDDTLQYFHQYLYPSNKLSNYGFTTALEKISVPDGIRLSVGEDSSTPLAVYEYTLIQTSERYKPYFEPKHYSHRRRRQDYPQLFRDTPLVFVVPSQSGLANHIKKSIGKDDVEVIELPFEHRDFGKFIENLVRPIFEEAGFPKKDKEVDPYEAANKNGFTEISVVSFT